MAVEAIKGERSLNELAGLYQVHPTQIAVWKKRALEGMPARFADGRRKGEAYNQCGMPFESLRALSRVEGRSAECGVNGKRDGNDTTLH